MAAVAQVDAVLIFHVLRQAVDLLGHARVEVDFLDAAVRARFAGNAPAVRIDDAQILDGEALDVGQQYAHAAPVAVVRFVGIKRVRAVGVVMRVPEIELSAGAPLLGNPVGQAEEILVLFRAGTGEDFRAVARCARVICADERTQPLAADVDV